MSRWTAPEDGCYAIDHEVQGGFRALAKGEARGLKEMPVVFRTSDRSGVPVTEVLAPDAMSLPNGQAIPAGTWTVVTSGAMAG